MRKHSPIHFLVFLFPLLLAGCHQTSTSTAPPMSPVGASSAPTLNPFGGPTRVSPPPTGSYASPNNYLSSPAANGVAPNGVAPGGTVAPGQVSPMPGTGFPTQSNNTVGSGVSSGQWASSVPSNPSNSVNGSGVVTASTFGVDSANPGNPGAGGMQVIDLTGAPPPPGYHPANSTMNISVAAPASGSVGQPVAPAGYSATSYPTPTYPTAIPPGTPMQNTVTVSAVAPVVDPTSSLQPLAPTTEAFPMSQPVVQSAGLQPIGSAPATAPTVSTSAGSTTFGSPNAIQPAGGTANTPNASSDANQDLMWRTPGTQ